jgi:FtsP/CotA-like multicopper oxidase with cupredoxin domain
MPNPDGSGGDRPVMLVNGIYPGPTLRAKWGDWIVVNVKNSLRHNGTGIHWHGLRQWHSSQHDGVPGISTKIFLRKRISVLTNSVFS